ncbi:MAG: hypothetical protein ABS874_05850 [Lachnospiraceae bacterium]
MKVENIASYKSIRRKAVTAVSVAASAFIQAAAMRTFLQPVNLLPGGLVVQPKHWTKIRCVFFGAGSDDKSIARDFAGAASF